MNIRFEKREVLKEKFKKGDKLPFGANFTDYMFVMDYKDGSWKDPRIVPYGEICLYPAASTFHYGQTVFEGLKAYRNGEKVYLFRPDENFKRLNMSCERLCIPKVDEKFLTQALIKLVDIERDWVPFEEDGSLYIRPFIIPTESRLGVHPSDSYMLIIILSPSGTYYANGLKPVKIYVEKEYVRAVRGGMGMAKTGGNYAVSLKSQVIANKQGYEQTLWLDGVERKYIEEVGAMNIFFVTKNGVITPELNGSILPGITRKSVIELLKFENINIEEKKISIEDIKELYEKGELLEIFGSGTAAVISPVGELLYDGFHMIINNNKIGEVSQKLYNKLTSIQWGKEKGPDNWCVEVK